MASSSNPLIPAWYDVVWSGMAVACVALLVVAIVSIARSATALSSGQALGWTAIAVFVPVLGPLAWLFIGRPASRSRVERVVDSR